MRGWLPATLARGSKGHSAALFQCCVFPKWHTPDPDPCVFQAYWARASEYCRTVASRTGSGGRPPVRLLAARSAASADASASST